MSDTVNRDRVRKNFTLPPDIAAAIEQHDNQSEFVEQAVRHETEEYHRRKVARDVIGEMTELFREMNGGELDREHRLVQSELLDEFDVFQQEAEITMSREPLEQVEGIRDGDGNE
jgi:hypothetical protein